MKYKGQETSKKICRVITSPQKNKWTNLFFYPDDSEILETWNWNSSFKYFWGFRIEKQIRLFVFQEKLRLNNFVSRSTDLYPLNFLTKSYLYNIQIEIDKVSNQNAVQNVIRLLF